MSGIPIYLFDKILNAKVEIYLKEIVKQGYVSRILEGFQINTKAIYFLSMFLKNSIFYRNSFVQGSRNVDVETGPAAGPTNFYQTHYRATIANFWQTRLPQMLPLVSILQNPGKALAL